MGHEQGPTNQFRDFLKDRQKRVRFAIAGMPGEITQNPPHSPDSKKAHISQIVKTKSPTDVPFTPDETKEMRRKHEKDQGQGNRAAAIGKVVLGVAVIGAGGVVLYETVPAIERSVDELGNLVKHWAGIGTSAQTGKIDATFEAPRVEVPLTFDPIAKEGIIGPENSIVATVENDPEAVAPKGMPEKGVGVLEKGNPEATIPLAIFNKDGTVPVLKYEFTRVSHSMVDNNMLSITEGIKPGMIVASPIKGTIYHGEAVRFMKNDGLIRRPAFVLDGFDENGRPIHITIITSSTVNPLINTHNRNRYKSKDETPKAEVNIGDPIFQFTEDIRNADFDGKSQLSYFTSGVGEIALNVVDGKVVFAAKPQPSASQQNP